MTRTIKAVVKSKTSTETREYSAEEGTRDSFEISANTKGEILLDIIADGDPIKSLEISGFNEIGLGHIRCSSMGNDNSVNIERIVLKNVRRIGSFFFSNSKVVHMDMKDSKCVEIPQGCFLGCTQLEEIILPTECALIGVEAFRNTSRLKSVTVYDNIRKICNGAFENSIQDLNLTSCIDLELVDRPFGENEEGRIELPFDGTAKIIGEFDISGNSISYKKETVKSELVNISGKTFVLTGKMWLPRADIENLIYREGGYVENKIGPGVDYLVSTRTDTTKYKAAVSRGITVISESSLRKALGR